MKKPERAQQSGLPFAVAVSLSFGLLALLLPAAAFADSTAPVVTITSPAAAASIAASGVNFTGTATDNTAVTLVRIYVYDEARSAFTASNAAASYSASNAQWSYPVLSSQITAGFAARLWVQAQDAAGNASSWQSVSVQVTGTPPAALDTTAPVVAIASPVNSSSVAAGGFVFSGTATDAVGVTQVRVYVYDLVRRAYTVNNAQATLTAADNTWSFAVQANQVTAGSSARLWVQARDAAGNSSVWQSVLVSVANTASLLGFSRVQVVSTQLMVEKRRADGTLEAPQAIKLRGVAYSPVDLGETVGSKEEAREHLRNSRYAEDFAMLEQLGANAIKTYVDAGTDAAALAILDEAYRRGLMVAVTLDIDAAEVQAVVTAYSNHPALLCWIIGNEWNLNGFFRNLNASQGAAQVNQIAQQIHSLDPNHPVASSLGFLTTHFNMGPDIVNREFPGIINAAPAVDLWALNVYRNDSFDPVFFEWSLISPKPFFFSEFGTDSWNAQSGLDEWAQADTAFNLWDEIHRQISINRPQRQCVGGFAFSWNDEWWKMGVPTSQQADGFSIERTITQSVTGVLLANFRAHPDVIANEEHFGLVTLARQAKQVFWVLQQAFRLGTLRTEALSVNARAAGNGPSGYVVFSKRGLPVYATEAAGIHLMTIARDTGAVVSLRRFNAATDPQGECGAFLSAVQAIADGDIAAVAISQNGLPADRTFGSAELANCLSAFSHLGAQQALAVLPQQPWALIAIAGSAASNLAESRAGILETVDVTSVIVLDADRDGTSDRVDVDNDNDGFTDEQERARQSDVLDSLS